VHKTNCKKAVQSGSCLTELEQASLIEIIRTQFVDIPKIIGFVSPEKASDFKKRNSAAH
jgi:hypothetical protein